MLLTSGELVFLVVEESLSMLAGDLKPNRITFLKRGLPPLVGGLLSREMHTLIGIIGFYKHPYIIVYPTDERNLLLEAVERLEARGEAAASGDALQLAFISGAPFVREGYGFRVILFTDGDSNAGVPLRLVGEHMALNGVRIDVVGVGRLSSRDRELLRAVASGSGGKFVHLSGGDVRVRLGRLIE